ncbi:protein S-acyltransferase [Salvia divinorum]|uniref:Protein S-acyltransferase n=1 Tax=Salvia divinorum TaxID=28513 RepID=A0ABD1I4F4_SALDI
MANASVYATIGTSTCLCQHQPCYACLFCGVADQPCPSRWPYLESHVGRCSVSITDSILLCRYDKKENPYSKGMIKNLQEVFFSRMPPSMLDFQAFVEDEKIMTAAPTDDDPAEDSAKHRIWWHS